MSDDTRTPEPEAGGEDEARRQLWIRAGVAGGLISLLLGGLALFDHLSRPPPPDEVTLPTRPIAPAQIMPDTGRDAPPDVVRAGGDAAMPGDAQSTLAPEGSAPPSLPDSEAAPSADKSDRLVEATRPLARPTAAASVHGEAAAPRAGAREAAPAKPAATAQTLPMTPVAPMPVPAPRPSGQAGAGVPAAPVAAPGVPSVRPPALAPVPQSASQLAAVAAPAAAQKPAAAPPQAPVPAETGRGYVLQFGFFSNVASAEELKARLAQAGVPSQIETRLTVGPFADRKDALAAQARLREKGVDVGVLLPLGR